ncbi:hypothetical protein C7N43_25500 [Sphingobacteriales bacterium UPWRP_1]|nr:hypothetical protein C7N43_25500 [Sphingobacteriales bacterium UPWRP_1]
MPAAFLLRLLFDVIPILLCTVTLPLPNVLLTIKQPANFTRLHIGLVWGFKNRICKTPVSAI